MSWLDVKYANLVSAQLERYKVKQQSPYIGNCRCPICGDSSKNKIKTRGYLLEQNGRVHYYCHNCGASMSLRKFLEQLAPTLYNEYLVESFGERSSNTAQLPIEPEPEPIAKRIRGPFNGLQKISQLDPDHPAKMYVVGRKLPNIWHSRLFYAPAFKKWVNSKLPGKFETTDRDNARILIPMRDASGKAFGVQGRVVGDAEPRYITIIFDSRAPKIFNLDNADWEQTVLAVEGPIDAMYLSNAIAMAGSDLVELPESIDQTNLVVVYDNECRNKEIVAKIGRAIVDGKRVCIWPTAWPYKDIGDAIESGIDAAAIERVIASNTYHGLEAELVFNEWRKA